MNKTEAAYANLLDTTRYFKVRLYPTNTWFRAKSTNLKYR
jgi:hypothetical protein